MSSISNNKLKIRNSVKHTADTVSSTSDSYSYQKSRKPWTFWAGLVALLIVLFGVVSCSVHKVIELVQEHEYHEIGHAYIQDALSQLES